MSPFSIPTDGAEIRGATRGNGQPIVLLHGGPGCYDYLGTSALADWLAPGCMVVSYDQRGCRHSKSDGPFTIDQNVSDLEAVRKWLGVPQFQLLGHSAGAVLAAYYLATYPDRVSRAVFLSPAPLRPGWREAFDRTISERTTPAQQQEVESLDARILRTSDPAERSELYRRRYETLLPCYLAPAHRKQAPTMPHFRREIYIAASGTSEAPYLNAGWRDAVRRFQAPSCIIHGRSDPIPWSVVSDYASILPQATVHALEQCGHFPWLETPDTLRALLIAFLGFPR